MFICFLAFWICLYLLVFAVAFSFALLLLFWICLLLLLAFCSCFFCFVFAFLLYIYVLMFKIHRVSLGPANIPLIGFVCVVEPLDASPGMLAL